jgi:hypothetical protein
MVLIVKEIGSSLVERGLFAAEEALRSGFGMSVRRFLKLRRGQM